MEALHIEGLNALHFLLAYAGMVLYLLAKLAEVFPKEDFQASKFIKENIITTIISVIGIPVLLVIATDSSLQDILPINNVTAVLCGWQTQSLFKSVFSMVSNRRGLNGDSGGGGQPGGGQAGGGQ